MFGRNFTQKDEIQAYIKAPSKLGCYLKQLIYGLSTAYGPSLSYDTVRRWKIYLNLKKHRNQLGQNQNLVKKSFQNKRNH